VLRAIALIILAPLALPAAADDASQGLPDDISESIAAESAAAGFTPEQHAALETLFLDALEDAIPADALLPRLQEGVAKRVPYSRLVQALEADVIELRRARTVAAEIDGGPAVIGNSASWLRAANLLAAGLDEEYVGALIAAAVGDPETFRPGSTLFVSLVDWGLAPERSAKLAQAAMSTVAPEAYPEVSALLAEAARARLDIEEAAATITAALNEGRTIRQTRRLLLR
jgi:hypothetical protein